MPSPIATNAPQVGLPTAPPPPTRVPSQTPTVAIQATATTIVLPSPTPPVLPNTFTLTTTFKATKCGSPGARPCYNVTLDGEKIILGQINGRNSYAGTLDPRSGNFKSIGTTNIGAGLAEQFDGNLTTRDQLILLRGTYLITGQGAVKKRGK